MFALVDVTKSFGGKRRRGGPRLGATTVLEGLSLTVESNRTTALIGPSGCGKSTVLRLLIGLLRPDDGCVTVDGVPVPPDNTPAIRALRHRVGYVIQDAGLFPHLSARGNVTLLARHLGWAPDRIEARLETLCMLCRFDPDLLNRRPSKLSGGQRQRVGLVRALFCDPDALLMDEPLGALDPIVRDELQGELVELFASLKKTVVIVTHDLAEAARMSDDLVLLSDGRVAQRGPFEELRDDPADRFVERFVTAHRGLPV
ncbi:ATP-binding cassette domain-containing protein [Alienimonas chondri]|uniref:Choline transport ATP-binding protein OpuBA n=1 Tax=Alienimonas chondri TaxID=2681879 RepID=A0ABX1VJ87_9PLAN|nr:ATP-binding cassette domain-containing protein [Alienimonas chondri]NNJ27605.1 Choline transport ATP-binding protein OpuBA [Alienimonas chondri]